MFSTYVELTGFEPVTPTLPVWCATNCAIAPLLQRGFPRSDFDKYTPWLRARPKSLAASGFS